MKLRYDREEDILTIETSSEKIDFAEELGHVIVHFSKGNKPVLLEILNASDFLTSVTRLTRKSKAGEPVELEF